MVADIPVNIGMGSQQGVFKKQKRNQSKNQYGQNGISDLPEIIGRCRESLLDFFALDRFAQYDIK
jgi:hypothetical protein